MSSTVVANHAMQRTGMTRSRLSCLSNALGGSSPSLTLGRWAPHTGTNARSTIACDCEDTLSRRRDRCLVRRAIVFTSWHHARTIYAHRTSHDSRTDANARSRLDGDRTGRDASRTDHVDRRGLSRKRAERSEKRDAGECGNPPPDPYPTRNGLPAIPVRPRPYFPALSWGEDTPEEMRVADTLLVWMVEARLGHETWCFAGHAVSRSWPGAPAAGPRRRIDCPEGRGHEARAYLFELAGDEVVKGVWRRVLAVVWRGRIGRYALSPNPEGEPTPMVRVERVWCDLFPEPPPTMGA